MPSVVAHTSRSHRSSSAGRMRMTQSILTMAPRAISMHIELMMSMSE